MKTLLKSFIFVSMTMLTLTGYGQKGVGQSTGLSRQGLNPEILEFKGTVQDIKIGPVNTRQGDPFRAPT